MCERGNICLFMCFAIFICAGIIMTTLGAIYQNTYATTAGILIGVGNCTVPCEKADDYVPFPPNKRDVTEDTWLCQGAQFALNATYTVGNETLLALNRQAYFYLSTYNCSMAQPGAEITIEYAKKAPGNVTSIHIAGYTHDNSGVIVGPIIIGLFICVPLFIYAYISWKRRSYSSF
jgi:hypothetical protein